jgi:hypothetical protein
MSNKTDTAGVITEARRWIGTPFKHRGHRIGHACDCVGLVRGICEDLELAHVPPALEHEFATYARAPNPRRMGELLETLLIPTPIDPRAAVDDGFVAWIEWRPGLPMHLALTATFQQRPTLIHAAQLAGKVVEHGFTAEWRNRVVSFWKLPNVDY